MYLEFFIIFLLSLFLIFVIRNNACKIGLLDIPNSRSTHLKHTPKGAGVGFYIATVLVVLVFNHTFVMMHSWIFISVFLVFVVGVLDDYYDIPARIKFFILILSSIFFLFDNMLISHLGTFFGVTLQLEWFALPFTIFAVVGFTNALNFIDGIDGLAATISIIILGTFFTVGYLHNDLFIMYVSGAFISTLLAFLVYNWSPASIFMGDSGSLTLGFVISILAIKSLEYLPAVSVLFIVAIPVLDTFTVMMHRKLNGQSMFSADKCHMHHIFNDFFSGDNQKTVGFLGLFQLIYSSIGLLQVHEGVDDGLLLLLFLFNVALFYLVLSTMIKKQNRKC